MSSPPPRPLLTSDRKGQATEPSSSVPPPPPLPAYLKRSSTLHSDVPPPPRMLRGSFRNNDNAAFLQTLQASNGSDFDQPFQPCYMFFYGSLMDAEVLHATLELSEMPVTRTATIRGHAVKMWGIYPALISDQNGSVSGVAWHMSSQAQFQRLEAYETTAYRWLECAAMLDDGEVIPDCRVFCWAGDPNSQELDPGSFDFERFQKYFKGSISFDL